MARKNQILAYVSSASGKKKYEVALEVDETGSPRVWLTGPGAGQLRIHCDCRSMINRTGVDERGNCKHIRAVLGYESTSAKLNRRSRNLIVEDKESELLVRSWR
jgi:hypothetical protein